MWNAYKQRFVQIQIFFLDWCFISQSNLWQLMKKHGELLHNTVIHCTRDVERVSNVVVWLIIICRKLILYRICKTLGDKNILHDNGLSQHLLEWLKILKKKQTMDWSCFVVIENGNLQCTSKCKCLTYECKWNGLLKLTWNDKLIPYTILKNREFQLAWFI